MDRAHVSGQLHDAESILTWSPAEKSVARRAFDAALKRELEGVMAEIKTRIARIERPSEIWELEHCLTTRRKQIDRQFDYRYSVLIEVFGQLLHEGKLTEEDLRKLGEDKLAAIHRYVSFLSSPIPFNLRAAAKS